MKKRKSSLKPGLLFALLAALLVACAFFFNGILLVLSNRFPLHVDLTANAAYEIGDDTKAVLAGLTQEVDVYVLSAEGGFSGSPYLAQAKRILDEYPRQTGEVKLAYVDAAADPAFAARYPDLNLAQGDVIVESGGRKKHIPVQNLFHYSQDPGGNLAVTASRAEEALTAAILNVTSGETVKVALLAGNGAAAAPVFTALLADNNYELATVNLTTGDLAGFDAALLLAPTADLSEDALRKLEAFLTNDGAYGKTLFYTAAAGQPQLPNLEAFLGEWGVAFGEGAVFETDKEKTYQYQPFYPTAGYADTAYTAELKDANMPFLAPVARPMRALFEAKDGHYVQTLLAFSETSGVRPADAPEDFTPAGAAETGPMPALALASYDAKTPSGEGAHSQIVAAASTEMLEALCLQNTSLSNATFLTNLFAALTERGDTVSIQPKSLAGQTLGATSAQVTALGVVLVGLVPFCILAAGAAVWFVRRYK